MMLRPLPIGLAAALLFPAAATAPASFAGETHEVVGRRNLRANDGAVRRAVAANARSNLFNRNGGRVASHDCTIQIAALLHDADLGARPDDWEEEVFDCEMDRLDTADGNGSNGNNGGGNGGGSNNGNNGGGGSGNGKGQPATRRLQLTPTQKMTLKQLWHSGKLVPNESKLRLNMLKLQGRGVEFDKTMVRLPEGLDVREIVSLGEDDGEGGDRDNGDGGSEEGGSNAAGGGEDQERPTRSSSGQMIRRTNMFEDEEYEKSLDDEQRQRQLYNVDAYPFGTRVGPTPILVVKVFDSKNRAISMTPNEIACNVFGPTVAGTSCTDVDNLKSTLEGCSMGKMQIRAGVTAHKGKYSAPGVIEVGINVALDEAASRYEIHDAVTVAVENHLGISALPGPYKHVMYLLENCYVNCGWAAYAYFNKWMSVYKLDKYARSSPVQVHELGHNFNLHHSGEGGVTYADHTGLMGNPYYNDDGNKMCYNVAKSWQLGWYNDRKVILDLKNKELNWSTKIKLVGIADYNTPEARSLPVVLKIETQTNDDYYIGFNRKDGVNANVKEYGDQVIVTKTGANGESRSISSIEANLGEGENYQLSIAGSTVYVSVEKIDTSSTPGIATIAVGRDEIPAPSSGTMNVVVNVMTDKYPEDTSWELTNNCDGTAVPMKKDLFTDGYTLYTDADILPSAKYTFTLNDSYGDGLCCKHGTGYYEVICDDVVVASGGEFSNGGAGANVPVTQTATFGACPKDTSSSTLPCPAGTVPIRVDIIADASPEEISWSLTNDCTGAIQASKTNFPDAGFAYSDDYCVPQERYTFRIEDANGDGIASGENVDTINGLGSYTVVYEGGIAATGGAFGAMESTTFGPACVTTDAPTQSPTRRPTSNPTAGPSVSPTSFPTREPSSMPTTGPSMSPTSSPSSSPATSSPTAAPSKAPSASPSASPTQSPMTSSPTAAPTTAPSKAPSASPSASPTQSPMTSKSPTSSPSASPTTLPTTGPSISPTSSPSSSPSSSPTTAPSKAPSAPPSGSPTRSLDSGCTDLEVAIKMDKYPEDVSWTLTNFATGSLIASGPDNEEYQQYQQYSFPFCVEPQDQHVFRIMDSYGDGLWKHGQGSYSIIYGGEVAFTGGNYTDLETRVIGPPLVATYDDALGAPRCPYIGSNCTSGALLQGRGDKKPESNTPNTLDGCVDGNSGNYLTDESIEMISVEALDGGLLQAGKSVVVKARVWAYDNNDVAEFWRKVDLDSDWQFIGRAQAPAGDEQHLSSPPFTLAASPTQAVRVQFGYKIPADNADACIPSLDGNGRWNDRDDLVFSVAT